MERRRYQLPYVDPGQRRPWVPYHEWLALREAERLRVPGVFRNERAQRARERREGVRFPRDAQFQQMRGRRARDEWAVLDAEEKAERYQEQVRDRRAKQRRMHRDAAYLYENPRFKNQEEEERAFDEAHGDYGGRYEEFLYLGDIERAEETAKRLLDEPEIDVGDLPVIGGKRVKFEGEE